MSPLQLRRTGNGVRFTVAVQPRARVTEVTGIHGEALRVRLTAPPVDGAANAALIDLLADTFDIPRASITIVSGAGARLKVVEILGVTEDQVRRLAEP